MRLGGYTVCICACAPVAAIADAKRGRGRRRRNPQDDKDDRARICPRGREERKRVLARSFSLRTRGMTRREKKKRRGEKSSRCRRRAIEREAEYERGRADRRGAAATIEREPVEREREESELLARSAVGSHGCAAYLHLLSPLFSLLHRRQPEPPRRTPHRFVVPLLGSACAPLSISLSLSLTRFDSRADRPLYPVIRFFFFFLSTSFLSFSVDSRFFTYNRT